MCSSKAVRCSTLQLWIDCNQRKRALFSVTSGQKTISLFTVNRCLLYYSMWCSMARGIAVFIVIGDNCDSSCNHMGMAQSPKAIAILIVAKMQLHYSQWLNCGQRAIVLSTVTMKQWYLWKIQNVRKCSDRRQSVLKCISCSSPGRGFRHVCDIFEKYKTFESVLIVAEKCDDLSENVKKQWDLCTVWSQSWIVARWGTIREHFKSLFGEWFKPMEITYCFASKITISVVVWCSKFRIRKICEITFDDVPTTADRYPCAQLYYKSPTLSA